MKRLFTATLNVTACGRRTAISKSLLLMMQTALGTPDIMAGTDTVTVAESEQDTSQTAKVAPLEQGRKIRLKSPIVPEFLRLEMRAEGTKPGAEFHQEQARSARRGPPKKVRVAVGDAGWSKQQPMRG